VKRRRKHSRILPLLILLVFIAALVFILKACFFSGGSKDANYSLEFSSQALVVGSTGTVKVAGLPENYDTTKISWSSSDSEVVKIDNDGTMHAKKVGSVTIAASVDGKNVPGSVKVVEMVDVKSITLDQTSATILSGDTLQLKADVSFANNEDISPPITWTSSNSSVARVSSDGLVSARDVGSTSITATVGNQSAVCVITVDKNPNGEPVQSTEGTQDESSDTTDTQATNGTTSNNSSSGSNTTGNTKNTAGSATTSNTGIKTTVKTIALSQNEAYLDVNETMTLEAAVSPAGTGVTWSSSNSKLATVSPAGVVTAKGAGSVTITAKAGGKSVSCTITIKDDAESQDTEPAATE
jgi:uncharacterized protein YjdB